MSHPLKSLSINRLHILGDPAVPVYLYQVSATRWILLEGGIQRWYQQVRQDLLKQVKDLSLISHWFITHSHYDHCGLLPLLVPELPAVKVVASAETAQAWKRPNGVEVIEKLNAASVSKINIAAAPLMPFSEIKVTEVADGDQVSLTENSYLDVLSTPGHCKGQLAFHLQPANLLFVADALGELTGDGHWNPLIFDQLPAYLSSIGKLAKLAPDWVLTGHHYASRGRDAVNRSLLQTREFISSVQRELKTHDDITWLAQRYSAAQAQLSESFLPKDLHVQSMKRMLQLIYQETEQTASQAGV